MISDTKYNIYNSFPTSACPCDLRNSFPYDGMILVCTHNTNPNVVTVEIRSTLGPQYTTNIQNLIQWNENDLKFPEAKRFMRLKLHQDGVEPIHSPKWQNVVAFMR